jgi:hypothetical protein
VTKTDIPGAAITGVFFGICYIFVAYLGEALYSFNSFAIKTLCFGTVAVVLAIVMRCLGRYHIFNPFFLAALWLPLDLAIKAYITGDGLLGFFAHNAELHFRLSSLIGFLAIPLAIVIFNTLIIFLIGYLVRTRRNPGILLLTCNKSSICSRAVIPLSRCSGSIVNPRAPPLSLV